MQCLNNANYKDLIKRCSGHTGICYSISVFFQCLKYFIISPKKLHSETTLTSHTTMAFFYVQNMLLLKKAL